MRDADSFGSTDQGMADATVVRVRWLPEVSWSKKLASETGYGMDNGPGPVMVIRH